jgi:hypothetical protein
MESVNGKRPANVGDVASLAGVSTHLSYRRRERSDLAAKTPRGAAGPRSGRASLWILALIMAMSLVLWISKPDSQNVIILPTHSSPALEVEEEPLLPSLINMEDSSIELRASQESARPQSAARTDGIGSLRGVLLDRTGEGVPERWTLVMRPNTAIRTPTPRKEVRAEFNEAQERFTVQDVPLGAYDVWVEAEGVNRRTTPVLLVKGSDSPFISLELHARGYLEGVVLDEPGAPVGGLQVTLLSTQGSGRSTRTDGAGRYLFEELIDGEYQLLIGAQQNPLVGPEELSFSAPSLHYPVRRVPELGSARVRAVDRSGLPLSGVRVDGFAPDGGILGGTSDGDGYCLVNNLVAGRYRLSLQGSGGAVGQGVCFVSAGEQVEIEVTIRR